MVAAWGKIRIEQAPDDADGNERFYIVQLDASIQSPQPGHFKDTKGPLRETVIRDFFKTFGHPEHEVDEMLRRARANYRPSK